jgi:hypothetical protein
LAVYNGANIVRRAAKSHIIAIADTIQVVCVGTRLMEAYVSLKQASSEPAHLDLGRAYILAVVDATSIVWRATEVQPAITMDVVGVSTRL